MKRLTRKTNILMAGGLSCLAAVAYWVFWASGAQNPVDVYLSLRDQPANRWVLFYEDGSGNWTRQGHAGLTYDSHRGVLMVFGSDTHGENWDN
jgi:hypothetical protein